MTRIDTGIDNSSLLLSLFATSAEHKKRKGKKNSITHSANRPGEMVPNSLCYIEQACAVIAVFATEFIKHRVLEFIQY